MFYMLEFPNENNKLTEVRVNWFLKESFRSEWICKHPETDAIDEYEAIFYMTRRIDWKKYAPNVPEDVAKEKTTLEQLRKWYYEEMKTTQEPATV